MKCPECNSEAMLIKGMYFCENKECLIGREFSLTKGMVNTDNVPTQVSKEKADKEASEDMENIFDAMQEAIAAALKIPQRLLEVPFILVYFYNRSNGDKRMVKIPSPNSISIWQRGILSCDCKRSSLMYNQEMDCNVASDNTIAVTKITATDGTILAEHL